MRTLILSATLLFTLNCLASAADLKLDLSKCMEPGMVELSFRNTSKAVIELEIPVEGAFDCYRYFSIEAERKDGKPAMDHLLYCPPLESYTVKIKPGGFYVHRIQPGAYPKGADVGILKKLRVKYTNPLTKTTTLSDWLMLEGQ